MPIHCEQLRIFYDSRLGVRATRLITARLMALWSEQAKISVLGIGFTQPYLRVYENHATRLVTFAPASIGSVSEESPCWRVIGNETRLPFPDCSFERILLAHVLEHSLEPRALLREAWRVLGDYGQLMAIVPNRTSWWAHTERTPFGKGQGFSGAQITELLKSTFLTPRPPVYCLFAPPIDREWAHRAAPFVERLESFATRRCAGIILAGAVKQHAQGVRVFSGFAEMAKHKEIVAPKKR